MESVEVDDDITPITTHVNKAIYGCMHVFLYDAQERQQDAT